MAAELNTFKKDPSISQPFWPKHLNMTLSVLSLASVAGLGVHSLLSTLIGSRSGICDCSGPENLSPRVLQPERGWSEQLIPVVLALAVGSIIGSVITLVASRDKAPPRKSLSFLTEIETFAGSRIESTGAAPGVADGERWIPPPGSDVRRIRWR